jgi:DNA-directed RNA polymerase alpha subunit
LAGDFLSLRALQARGNPRPEVWNKGCSTFDQICGQIFNLKMTALDPMSELPDDTPVGRVRFPPRIRNALHEAGVQTIGEIREASDASLLSLQNLGKGSVTYLRKTLGLPSSGGVRPDWTEKGT